MTKKSSPTLVHLHKDKHMRLAKDSWEQPCQLDLFQVVLTENFSNSVEFYQSLPDIFTDKQEKYRNLDGSLPVLIRKGMYKQIPYALDISPAYLAVEDPVTGQRKKLGFYKTVIAEFVEYALHKLSISEGFFLNEEGGQYEQFGLITTYYRVREELGKMGKTYSYDQIRDAINVLAGLRYQLSWEASKAYGVDSFFSPIDLIIKNDRKNPQHSELYITFNRLISKKILSLDWRAFNYAEFMQIKSSFGRTLFMRLSHRFAQADPVKGYHFLLSTLVKEGALVEDEVTLNIRKIKRALEECRYIIDRYSIEEITAINPATKRRMTVDLKVTILPTKAFQSEQYSVNTHQKAIQEHRFTPEGRVITKPLREQYPNREDFGRYLDDRKAYEQSFSQSGKAPHNR